VEDLLDVSRIITGKLAIEAKELNLNNAVVAAVETMRDAAAQKKIHVDLDVPAGRVLLRGDESRLVQVFCNLLSNAIKFTDAGGHIKVAVTENGQEATVTVTDTGCGIPSNFLPHVFDSFQQGEWFQTRKHEGLGLGLSIVRSLVELHDGRVDVHSSGVGQGTVFSVHIPLLRGKQTTTLQRAASASADAVEDGPGTILVVNDTADTNELLRIVFESHGWRVFTAATVVEALTLFDEIQPSIVITDIGLPGESGFTLRTRLTEQGHASTPVIALSGYTRSEDIERARSLGFADYLSIPLDMQNLVNTVERLAIGRAATASGD
jgi:CheY-like chemotaxis protein